MNFAMGERPISQRIVSKEWSVNFGIAQQNFWKLSYLGHSRKSLVFVKLVKFSASGRLGVGRIKAQLGSSLGSMPKKQSRLELDSVLKI